jgi:hypothetical protein
MHFHQERKDFFQMFATPFDHAAAALAEGSAIKEIRAQHYPYPLISRNLFCIFFPSSNSSLSLPAFPPACPALVSQISPIPYLCS